MWALLFHKSLCCWSCCRLYALTKTANSAGWTQTEKHKRLDICFKGQISNESLNFLCGDRTITADLAITVAVTGFEEHLGLSISQCTGTCAEVLQKQPATDKRGV